MASGRCTNFYKSATLALFDGSASARTLWIHPGLSLAGLQLSLSANATAASDGRAVARFQLQAFTGATPNGSGGWTGGSWATFWSIALEAFSASTAAANGLVSFRSGLFAVEFDPPMQLPYGFRSSVQTGNDHAAKGGLVPPNTHNATETAGEWDIKGFWTTVQSTGNSAFDGDANVQMLTNDEN